AGRPREAARERGGRGGGGGGRGPGEAGRGGGGGGARGPPPTTATTRTGEPSAPSMRSGRARNRQRSAPIWSRLVRYSMTVIPAGKNTWCVVHSAGVSLTPGSKIDVRTV